MSFRTDDQVLLRGRLFGRGARAVVLSHMGRGGDSQEDWWTVAAALARRGYLVLTYNRRGVCSTVPAETCSGGTDNYGEHWRDVAAAASFVQKQGASTVLLGGASIGAMATFYAATRGAVHADGLVWLAGVTHGAYTFDRHSVRALPRVPILYLSAADDGYGAGGDTRQMYGWSRSPRRLVILPGSEHGTDLVMVGAEKDRRDRIVAQILRFADDIRPS